MRRLVVFGLVLLAVAGVAAIAWGARPGPLPPASVPGLSCTARSVGGEWMPDRVCTPGAVSPRVTQGNIVTTICRRGWATQERKRWFPYSASEPVKRHLVRVYGEYAGASLRAYENDHLVAISSGGDPADGRNLWPQAPATPNRKDAVEAAANHAICTGRMSLAHVQEGFMTDWQRLGAELGVSGRAAVDPDDG